MEKRLTYEERMHILHDKKIEQTQEKIKANGYMDGDDYGTVILPEGFKFEPIPNNENGGFYGYDGWSKNFEALMKVHPIYVDPLEILCGRWRAMLPSYNKGWAQNIASYEYLMADQEEYGVISGIGADSHFSSDYNIGLKLGFGGILEKIRAGYAAHPDRKEFYEAHERVYLAIQEWIGRHIEEIRRLLETEQRPEIRESLQEMLECNEHVISDAPKTFIEACQWMAWFACVSRIYNRDGAGCLLDSTLLPYYEKDIKDGILTDDKARFILANLLLIDPQYYQLSGCDDEGRDLTNRVSYLILDGAHWLDSSANITIRVHDNLDPEFYHQAVKYLFTDRKGWPRFSGHKGLMTYTKNGLGITDHISNSRIAVGCHWMAVPGLEYGYQDCVKINCAKLFEKSLNEMMAGEGRSLDELWERYCGNVKKAVDVTAEGIKFHLAHQHQNMPELVMNPLMEGPMEEGLNITQCAKITTVGIDGTGLAVIADSFAAIEQRVVEEKRLTWEEMYEAVQANFEGYERTRLMLSTADKYCGSRRGDRWAKRISDEFTETVKAYPMPEGKGLIPGWFSWSNTIYLGEQVGATPNGRLAHTPITHGANPTPGFRKDGAATAQATGIARIQPHYGNTAPLQIELDPRLSIEEGGLERVKQLIKTHIDMGGTLVNINVLDKDTLMEAHRDPSTHPELVVRVTGFTAYFIALSPEFRQLVVDRFLDAC